MVVYDRSITKPNNIEQNITTKAVHDTFCINADNKQQNMKTMAVKTAHNKTCQLWLYVTHHIPSL